MHHYIERLPTPLEYNSLRYAVGWVTFDVDTIERSLEKSVYCICVEYDNELIGLGRVVGDGGVCFYIHDVIVLPKFRRKGIGEGIFEHFMKYFSQNATKGSYIAAMVGKGAENLYSKYNFWIRPNKILGPGMMQFWDDPDMNAYHNVAESNDCS
uniref:Acetyltransferase (GNAT) domain-containing protein n=1 Tax=Candidatus Kentrum sp. MB TaxID=2138164 RepID=A0A450XLI7_9GAMM|nr:MAG: Acetyltransferase (GNAT) domain-containing protein [Candidatus Kentron sp. MB]VFK35178.1 MAG: Acetyltransferase (GNAT) domain-containing protein [Candidatus Kentron sp. MB]VFK77111.1 MAG: Acetyltransferase (GNAT) domain-containing protein [Candidatus Kentron sp. MB]